ncbi:MAG: LCP family protein [Propionibacteriales bacterium]|nr:LCP family protein [Propionibacteriales bacterium]
MPDGPDEQDAPEASREDDVAPAPAAKPLPVFRALDDLPAAPPQVELINDRDLSWVDKPEISDEERERRRARRDERRKKVHRRRRLRRAAKVGGVLFATFTILFGFWAYWTLSGLQRMPAIEDRGGLNTPGQNILLVGRNPAEPEEATIGRGGWRNAFKSSDLVMVLHLTRDNRAMFVISIPGDSLLPIPADGTSPARQGLLSDAFATGGQNLYVRTVEEFTGARMDRVAVLDMNGLAEIANHLGGVIVEIPTQDCGLQAGPRKLDGASALEYVALNPCLPRHDLDRVDRQQSLLRGLMRTAVDGNRIANPFTLSRLLKSTASHLTLEEDFGYPSMFGTMFSMRGLRSATTTFLTVPTAGDPFAGGNGAVLLDRARGEELFTALRSDKLAEYLALNKDITTR